MNAEPLMSIDYQTTLQDYKHFLYFNNRFSLIMVSVFYSVVFTVVALMTGASTENLVFLIPIGLIVGAVGYFIMITTMMLKANRVYKSSKIWQRKRKLHFTEQGIQIEDNGLILWSDVYKVKESKRMFLIFFSQIQSLLIKKNLVDEEKFRIILKTHVEDRKLKLI